jgi:hypothetical protein
MLHTDSWCERSRSIYTSRRRKVLKVVTILVFYGEKAFANFMCVCQWYRSGITGYI